ncbi:molybdopterin-guanine dinucleotide biosynthesis protein B [Paenibacillus faecis]|uniref:molybdopterin-guanine dinucleotide biosynthesis protein B n=1 Tax=Paenibacillus faecis TaxID=862114 RepID=UPI0020136A97|nr:molybdopterin-guanine dinucleotide biosynthesis protein B [Paenibacillus faecis]
MIPVLQVAGYKNSGKTTLISRLLPLLREKGIRAAVIKHDVHGFEGDMPGTDTHAFRTSGAEATAITSPWRTAVVEERETPLTALIERFHHYDLIVIEGFKREPYPKLLLVRDIEEDLGLLDSLTQVIGVVFRPAESRSGGLAGEPDSIVMTRIRRKYDIPVFHAENVEEIVRFIETYEGNPAE